VFVGIPEVDTPIGFADSVAETAEGYRMLLAVTIYQFGGTNVPQRGGG